MGVPREPETVWAVWQLDSWCDDSESHDGDVGVRVVELFADEQVARQWVRAHRDSWNGSSYRVRSMRVHRNLKTAGDY